MSNRQLAKALVKFVGPLIAGYVRVKVQLLGRNPTVDEAIAIAIEASPRFVNLILDDEELGLREPVGDEVRSLIMTNFNKLGRGQMVSESKLRANCENAKRGGVKTAEGKAVSKNNSLKHGILAQGSVPGDSIALDDIYEQFCREFNPKTPSSEVLVQQLALTVVRLARCSRLEVEIFKEQSTWHLDSSVVIERLAALGERYENRLVGRMLLLIEALKEK